MNKLNKYMPSKSFIIGVIITVGVFSRYIFGDNNLAEEVSEMLIKTATDVDINFSKESPENPENDLNRLVK